MSNLENKIKKHLQQQYKGIFLPPQIDKHIKNYVENAQSSYLVQKISPLVDKGAKILDIGSGYGSFVFEAIHHGYDAYGIEIESFEHEISKERAVEELIDPKRFAQGSALSLPYPDESFDMVSFWNVLEHISDYKQAIREAKRVLKTKGKIFIIAPNYCAFRKEAHYHVPWIPLFPKPLARLYLRFLGRETTFLDNCIFYVTIFGVKRYLVSQNLHVSIDINEKIRKGFNFHSSYINRVVQFCRTYRLTGLLEKAIFFFQTHPFTNSIDIVAKK
ncbi:MAG TPA: class I SAM-dependent methyltransferase [Holosporales bacterium]|nr:class I SAM-dependent methyltransferase [Holosporales bacterium]